MKRQKIIHKCDIAFALALVLKFFGAGFCYFCTLDDFIQYGSYPLFDLSHVLFQIGTISARPLASFLDPTLWGAFYPNMAISLLLLGVLYFLSALFLDRILIAQNIKLTPVLYAVYLLLPLTFEGTYWLSASTRIVVGLFFAGAAALLLLQFLNTGKKRFLPFYIVLTWLSFGFYESVLVFSGLIQCWILVHRLCKTKSFQSLWLLTVPAIGAAGLLLYYKLAAGIGALGSRAAGFSFDQFPTRLADFFSQLGYIFTAGLFRTTFIGFIDGFRRISADPLTGWLPGILILFVSCLCAYTSRKHRMHAKASVCTPAGIVLTLFPLIPNLLVPDVWLTYRTVFLCIPGLLVLFAPLAAALLKNRYVRMTAVFLMVLLFSVGCFNELHTYKEVSTLDTQIAKNIAEALDEDVLSGSKNTILVLPHEIVVPQTSYYKDHVKSVTGADWSLTGAVRAVSRNNNIRMITPVYSLEGVDTEGKLILYMDETYQITEEQYE